MGWYLSINKRAELIVKRATPISERAAPINKTIGTYQQNGNIYSNTCGACQQVGRQLLANESQLSATGEELLSHRDGSYFLDERHLSEKGMGQSAIGWHLSRTDCTYQQWSIAFIKRGSSLQKKR